MTSSPTWRAWSTTRSRAGDAFELLRAMTGRRSVDQLRSMDWHGDGEAVLPVFTFGPFHPSTDDIEE
jgi:hypothetical protein